jgi:hypothetical protein
MAPAVAAPGATITIQGSGFGSARGWVRIGHTFAPVISWSNTTVVAKVPAILDVAGRIAVRILRRDYKYTAPLYLEITSK